MFVTDIKLVESSDYCELQATVNSKALDEPFNLWYKFPTTCKNYLGVENGDPFLAALLLPAMRTGEGLDIPTPVSPKLLASISEVQAIYRSWEPRLSRVNISAPVKHDAETAMAPRG